MKIVVASDSYKGSLSSLEIGEIVAKEARKIYPDLESACVSIADGGEGTLDAILQTGKFQAKTLTCKNPLQKPVTCRYAMGDGVAFVEMAEASGLNLIPYKDGNVLHTTTYGTGELILDAIESGAKNIYIAVGGSATNDGGMGAMSALGAKFLDKDGNRLTGTGEELGKVETIDLSEFVSLDGITFTILCDVDNPLLGERGATYYYAPQKGARKEDLPVLEQGMTNYADKVEALCGVHLHDKKSAGAAGGLAAGLMAFLGATPTRGIDAVLDMIDFDELLTGADLVITGEGRIDFQSACGKAISGVVARAKKKDIPVYAFVGASALKEDEETGLSGIYTLVSHAESAEDSIQNAPKYLAQVAKEFFENYTARN